MSRARWDIAARSLQDVRLQRLPERSLALDGDGSVLMHMGVLSTIGYARPNNLIHVVLDNEGYVSTGGQLSTSSSPDAVASACGYRTAALARTILD
ncbi:MULTISPECIES: thiamine pyrophosphate-dependent enzyme [unclassified Bradyrhizobium]|uniref:thiamine pyrophosphate-dependent enzyme n=1 Tax=unclassified Bradyrhizobium TaxID=2631580 RepID=UPI002112C900|nr:MULTISPECIES: thiamine pyrophosphate-dependent enzyme [unclassified Bradyrhizobium]